jgi:cytochrome P450
MIDLGIVFRHDDHNARIIHKALVYFIDNHLIDRHLDRVIEQQMKQICLSDKFDVRHTTFDFAVRLLATLSSSFVVTTRDDRTFELFQQNLYKISKAVHTDNIQKSTKTILTKLTGLSETLDLNENVLNYIQTWIVDRHNRSNTINVEHGVTSTTSNNEDFLDAFLQCLDESSPRMDDEDIAACILDIIMHGSEMLKAALSWLLLYAVKYPDEADTCRREVR